MNRRQLMFSKEWTKRSKKRYRLRFRRIHGKAVSANVYAMSHHMPGIQMGMVTYAVQDTWNADEFDLFNRPRPCWTFSKGVFFGQKKDLEWLSFLPCCNADGSGRLPLKITGPVMQPCAFMKKSEQQRGFDHYSNREAWMNCLWFFVWMDRLDAYIGWTEGWKILFMIDNCSTHNKPETIPSLQNILVEFLPPNTTSRVQPLDAGIITCLN